MKKYKLDKRVGAPTKYNWDTYKVGECRSFIATMSTIMPAAYGFAKRSGKKFSGKKNGRKIMITRIN